jgi:hypothetical protein
MAKFKGKPLFGCSVMAFSSRWMAAATLGAIALASPARAETPSVYYAWRSLEGDATACIDRARRALQQQNLLNVQQAGNSLSGQLEATTAVIMCLDQTVETTTVMVVTSSLDGAAALNLREALKDEFQTGD